MEISNVHKRSYTSLYFSIEKLSTCKSRKAKEKFSHYRKPDFDFGNIFEFLVLFYRLCRKWIFDFLYCLIVELYYDDRSPVNRSMIRACFDNNMMYYTIVLRKYNNISCNDKFMCIFIQIYIIIIF